MNLAAEFNTIIACGCDFAMGRTQEIMYVGRGAEEKKSGRPAYWTGRETRIVVP